MTKNRIHHDNAHKFMSQATTDEAKQKVLAFYEKDSISHPTPNRKAIMPIKVPKSGALIFLRGI